MKYLSLTITDPGGNPIKIGGSGEIPTGGISTGTLSGILQAFVSLFFLFAIILCLFALIYTGFQWILSMGDKQKLAEVKQRLIYSIVGLVVVLMSFMVVGFVGNFFGVRLFH